jgi:hypothetical protein
MSANLHKTNFNGIRRVLTIVYDTQNQWRYGFIHRPELMLALSMGPNRTGFTLTSTEVGNRSSFRNVVFSSYLEFRTMENIHKASDSVTN